MTTSIQLLPTSLTEDHSETNNVNIKGSSTPLLLEPSVIHFGAGASQWKINTTVGASLVGGVAPC